MLLMVEKGTRDGICHAIHRYAKANNNYMKTYDKNIELPIKGFKWINKLSELNEDFIKNYNDNNDKGYILEVDVEYPKNLFNLHRDLPFLPESRKIKQCKKLVCNIHNKENYVMHRRALKEALNYRLILKKVHKVI